MVTIYATKSSDVVNRFTQLVSTKTNTKHRTTINNEAAVPPRDSVNAVTVNRKNDIKTNNQLIYAFF